MTPDGIGAPRKPEIVERDELVLTIVNEHNEHGARVGSIANTLELDIDLIKHSLSRLRRAGKVERRDGYRWWPV